MGVEGIRSSVMPYTTGRATKTTPVRKEGRSVRTPDGNEPGNAEITGAHIGSSSRMLVCVRCDSPRTYQATDTRQCPVLRLSPQRADRRAEQGNCQARRRYNASFVVSLGRNNEPLLQPRCRELSLVRRQWRNRVPGVGSRSLGVLPVRRAGTWPSSVTEALNRPGTWRQLRTRQDSLGRSGRAGPEPPAVRLGSWRKAHPHLAAPGAR